MIYDVKWSEAQRSLKRGYCSAAEDILKRQGKKNSQREIYRLSGVSPEVQRANRSMIDTFHQDNSLSLTYLIDYWRFTPPYGHKGKANTLQLKSDVGRDFRDLCAESNPGFGYKAILQDLIDTNVVTCNQEVITLRNIKIISTKTDKAHLVSICRSISPQIAAILHNLTIDDHADGTEYVKSMERWLATSWSIQDMSAFAKEIRKIMKKAMAQVQKTMDEHEAQGTDAPTKSPATQILFVETSVHVDPPLKQEK